MCACIQCTCIAPPSKGMYIYKYITATHTGSNKEARSIQRKEDICAGRRGQWITCNREVVSFADEMLHRVCVSVTAMSAATCHPLQPALSERSIIAALQQLTQRQSARKYSAPCLPRTRQPFIAQTLEKPLTAELTCSTSIQVNSTQVLQVNGRKPTSQKCLPRAASALSQYISGTRWSDHWVSFSFSLTPTEENVLHKVLLYNIMIWISTNNRLNHIHVIFIFTVF